MASSGRRQRDSMTRRILRSRVIWVVLAAMIAMLLPACDGSNGSGGDGAGSQTAAQGAPLVAKAVTRLANPAPDFELVLFGNEDHDEGEVIRLSELAGTPVVLNFWFPSCSPCRAEMPDIEASFQRHKGDGVRFVGVTNLALDTADDAREFIAEIGVTYSLGADTHGTIMRAYDISGFPSTVFIDREHNFVRKWTGILNEEKLEELIQEMLN